MGKMGIDELNELAEGTSRRMGLGGAQGVRLARKAILHAAVLDAIRRASLFGDLTFKGGSCLAEVYGNPRLSEDLDFAAAPERVAALAGELGDVLGDAVSGLVDAKVAVRCPDPGRLSGTSVPVARWTVSLDLCPDDPSVARERLKVEVAGVPVHDATARLLVARFGAGAGVVVAESIDELLADKLVSFAESAYLRHRDAWDIVWLLGEGADGSEASRMAVEKVSDYGYTVLGDDGLSRPDTAPFGRVADRAREVMQSAGFRDLAGQLPQDVAARTVLDAAWLEAAEARLVDVCREVASRMHGDHDDEGPTEAQLAVVEVLGGDPSEFDDRQSAQAWIDAALGR